MTPTQRALRIIRDERFEMAGQFAELMWPNSGAWKKNSHVGRGSAFGVGITRAGGSFLGKLRRRGLIDWHMKDDRIKRVFFLTDAGRAALKESEEG